jgi:phosphoribosylpyrophosphate synthetase
MELLLMIDAAKDSARHATAVTVFGWQDKIEKTKPRVPIGAKLVAKFIRNCRSN